MIIPMLEIYYNQSTLFLSWCMTYFISRNLSKRMVLLLQTLKSCCWQLFVVILINKFLLPVLFVVYQHSVEKESVTSQVSEPATKSTTTATSPNSESEPLQQPNTPSLLEKNDGKVYVCLLFPPIGLWVICLWLLTPNLASQRCMYGWHVFVFDKIDYHFGWRASLCAIVFSGGGWSGAAVFFCRRQWHIRVLSNIDPQLSLLPVLLFGVKT